MSEITIRGRIATTTLRRGETVTVEHTDVIDRLIAGGYVEPVGQPAPAAAPEQDTAEAAVDAAAATEANGVESAGEPEAEAVARRKPARKRSSS